MQKVKFAESQKAEVTRLFVVVFGSTDCSNLEGNVHPNLGAFRKKRLITLVELTLFVQEPLILSLKLIVNQYSYELQTCKKSLFAENQTAGVTRLFVVVLGSTA